MLHIPLEHPSVEGESTDSLFFRPSFEKVNLWTENLLFHLEHGMSVPHDLQMVEIFCFHAGTMIHTMKLELNRNRNHENWTLAVMQLLRKNLRHKEFHKGK